MTNTTKIGRQITVQATELLVQATELGKTRPKQVNSIGLYGVQSTTVWLSGINLLASFKSPRVRTPTQAAVVFVEHLKAARKPLTCKRQTCAMLTK